MKYFLYFTLKIWSCWTFVGLLGPSCVVGWFTIICSNVEKVICGQGHGVMRNVLKEIVLDGHCHTSVLLRSCSSREVIEIGLLTQGGCLWASPPVNSRTCRGMLTSSCLKRLPTYSYKTLLLLCPPAVLPKTSSSYNDQLLLVTHTLTSSNSCNLFIQQLFTANPHLRVTLESQCRRNERSPQNPRFQQKSNSLLNHL